MRIRSIAVAASLALACGSSVTATPEGSDAASGNDAGADGSTSVSGDVQPLLIAFTFHLEGPNLVASKDAFDRYVSEIKNVASNFHRNGAIATWEAAEIVDKSISYNSKALKELEDGGDAIGLHANGAGYVPTDANYTVEKMAKELTRQRDALKSLGVNVRHVSNICSTVDWVKAIQSSGFEAATGVVEFCLKSLSTPPAEVASCSAPNLCHGAYPKATEDAMTPWYASDGATWTTPASSGLLIVPTRGAMPCAAEEAGGTVSPTQCKYGDDDAATLLAQLDAAVAARKAGKVHTFVFVASFGQTPNATILENFLKSIKTKYIDTGKAKWAGVPAIIDAVKAAP